MADRYRSRRRTARPHGLKTNEAYHSKADPLVIPEMYFFLNLPSPFFGNVGFVKFGTFSALLALPVMIRERYGQIVYETLPHILLSNASLVTKSCIARFVEGDAFNPSALSDCSTGSSPPLAHGKSTLSPSEASAGCSRAGLFGRFCSICEQTAHRIRKIRAQCERSPIHVLKTFVSFGAVEMTHFLRAFVNTLSFFGLRQAAQCQRPYY